MRDGVRGSGMNLGARTLKEEKKGQKRKLRYMDQSQKEERGRWGISEVVQDGERFMDCLSPRQLF